MKSLNTLWKELSSELGSWCCTSTTQDYKKLLSRVEHEGDEFLTITLPAFGKDFERCLDAGQVVPGAWSGFKTKAGLPLFLGGFLERVFDRGTGCLLDEPCIDSIFAVRQLTLMYAKILRPCSDARTEEAMRQFIQVDAEIKGIEDGISDERWKAFERVSTLLYGGMLSDVEDLLYQDKLLPRHGPGTTADGLVGNHKYAIAEWTTRLEQVFPFLGNATPNWSSENLEFQNNHVDFREPGAERPTKVTPVPKTLKNPRIISIEPTYMQYMQQALARGIVSAIEKDDVLSRFIGFSDQSVNRALARRGSSNGELATLDLSEASDRVTNQQVRRILGRHPYLRDAVDGSRSRKAGVPVQGNRTIVTLNKFASMGSALCFPMEAMVFLTIAFIGIERSAKHQLTRKDLRSFFGQVRVYGDDIIVPVEYVRSVIDELEAFGLKVNVNKSFWTGKFRESCGGDYYDGEPVIPVRLRRDFPATRRDTRELVSLVAFRNQLYQLGLWRTSAWIDETFLSPLLGKRYVVVDPESSALGRHSACFLPKGTGWDTDIQRANQRVWVPVNTPRPSKAGGRANLMKCLLSLEERSSSVAMVNPDSWMKDSMGWDDTFASEPTADSEHLEYFGRPVAVNTKQRETPLLTWGGFTTY